MTTPTACQGLVNQMQSVAALNTGNCLPYSGVAGRLVRPSYSCNGDHKFYHAKILLKGYDSKRRSFACTASISRRKNPDFSRESKGFSRGWSRQNQERENSENSEGAMDLLSSKNGPLPSLSSKPRHQATATPGQREKEIVELFRKVQAQLRERTAIKEEKKVESSSQGQAEKGTVDSLLSLLRKHTVDQGKKKSREKNFDIDQPERSSPPEDGQSSSFFESNSIVPEEDVEETTIPAVARRPPSNFQRRSPVPQMKYQPVYSVKENVNVNSPLESAAKKNIVLEDDEEPINLDKHKAFDDGPLQRRSPVPRVKYQPVYSAKENVSVHSPLESAEKKNIVLVDDEEPISLDEHEAFDDGPLESSEDDDTDEETTGLLPTENADLSLLKISELRALAKSRGMKRYSKLKKCELLELLSSEGD